MAQSIRFAPRSNVVKIARMLQKKQIDKSCCHFTSVKQVFFGIKEILSTVYAVNRIFIRLELNSRF